jgi:hypothetical protein
MKKETPWHGVIVDRESLPSLEDFLIENGLDWRIGKTILPLPPLVKNEDILVDGVPFFDFVDKVIAKH